MKIAIIPNTEKKGAVEITNRIIERLKLKGAEVYTANKGFDAEILSEESIYDVSDIIITVGGDGTLIKYAKKAALFGKAVLGINAGRLGFLADVERENLELIDRLVDGKYTVCPRLMLETRVYKNNELISEGISLNDTVIASSGIAKLLDLEVSVADDTIKYRADGVIVSTPTGSTAYSMSAGGPIIDPGVRCFALTPICSHFLTARPIVVGEDSKLSVRLQGEQSAIISLDGNFSAEIDSTCKVEIAKSKFDAKLINISKNTIYKTLSLKF